jgi:peptidoglycan/xylan/chitin deacetylase (PgdA/CDA1 family)
VKATFMLLGKNIAGKENILRKMFYAGHNIGNHSKDKTDFGPLFTKDIDNQIDFTDEAIKGAIAKVPKYFRQPYNTDIKERLQ